MATATTLTTLYERLIRELALGELIANGKLTAFAATSITAPDILRDSRKGANYYSSQATVIERPGSATAADRIRYAGALTNTSGLLAHTGADYADTTIGSETVRLWFKNIRPDLEIIDAINRALEFVPFSTYVAISHGGDLDFDMAVSTDTNWTNVGSPGTSAKDATARRTPFGLRNYHLINASTDEGTQSATLPVTQGRIISAFTISSVNVGEASFRPYDVTNSAAFDTALEHTEEEPQLMVFQNISVPATCKEMAMRMLGTTSTSDVYWNQLWVYKQDNLRVNLPGYVSEEFKAPQVFQGRPRQQTANGIYDAQSMDMVELVEGRDYRYGSNQPDANPHWITFDSSSWYNWPLFVQARRPYSDLGALSAESDTTYAPLHQLMPAIKMRVLTDVLIPKEPQNPRWQQAYAVAYDEWTKATAARPVLPIGRRQSFRIGRA